MIPAHDIGGDAAGAIDTGDHQKAFWEQRVDALANLLSNRGIIRTDEGRRAREALGRELYFALSYSARMIVASSNLLIEKNIFTSAELAAKMADVERRG
jgi:hypothetical protein